MRVPKAAELDTNAGRVASEAELDCNGKKMYKNVKNSYDNAQNNKRWRISGDRRTTRPRSVFFLLSQPSDVDGDCRVNTERPEATLGGNSVFVTPLGPTNSRYCENAN